MRIRPFRSCLFSLSFVLLQVKKPEGENQCFKIALLLVEIGSKLHRKARPDIAGPFVSLDTSRKPLQPYSHLTLSFSIGAEIVWHKSEHRQHCRLVTDRLELCGLNGGPRDSIVCEGNRLSSVDQVQSNVVVAGDLVMHMALSDISRDVHMYILLLGQPQQHTTCTRL